MIENVVSILTHIIEWNRKWSLWTYENPLMYVSKDSGREIYCESIR